MHVERRASTRALRWGQAQRVWVMRGDKGLGVEGREAWQEMRSEVSRSQVTRALGCLPKGGEIFILRAKGSHGLAGYRVGMRAALLVLSRVPERQAAPGHTVSGEPLGGKQNRAFYDTARVRMPLSLKGSRSPVLSSGQERPGDAAETNRPKTLRAQNNNTLLSSLVDWHKGSARAQAHRPDTSGTLPSNS